MWVFIGIFLVLALMSKKKFWKTLFLILMILALF
nr:MAG TPA: Lipopolysaccharide export system ATP-binding protein transport, ABC-transporter, LIPID TRANSPORT [Herelleviridae sp.]